MIKTKITTCLSFLLIAFFTFAQSYDPNFYYQLQTADGRVVGNNENANAGAYLVIETANSTRQGQYWKIDDIGNGYIMFTNVINKLSIDNNKSGNKQLLQWSTTPSNQNQHWKLTPVSGKEATYTLSCRSNFAQNIAYNSSGALNAATPDANSENQQFKIIKTTVAVVYPKQEHWENEAIFEENKEKAHASYFPYNNKAELMADTEYFLHPWNTTKSTLVQSLNGNWKFKWVKQPADSIPGFYQTDFDVSAWENITVPSSWEMQGFGRPFYMNEAMPFENKPPYVKVLSSVANWDNNSIGSYRRNFTIPANWSNKQIFVNFEGIYSAAYIYVNGKYVGYTEAANTDHQFDITHFTNVGENSIAVKVVRWSDGSYLENQDMFRMSGIYRDVNLIALPKTFVRDHNISSVMTSSTSTTGTLNVELSIQNRKESSTGGSVEVDFLTADGTVIKQVGTQSFTLAAGEEKKLTLTTNVSDIKLWSAEAPNLYTVLVKLKDVSGNETEAFATKYGFRTVEIKKSLVYINGKRIVFKGANRHDADPEAGRAVTTEMMLKDVLLFKQNNLNIIRTAHYPNQSKMYAMFDHYGLWVMDEADLECHGAQQLSGEASWIPAFNNRVTRMIYRDRNHPSVVFWSLGNECGGGSNFKAAYDAAKAIDTTRPLHYEGGDSKYTNFTDMQSKMYPSVDWVIAEDKSSSNRPLFICEFAHSMGNALGNFQEYWDEIEDSKRTIGACVWDWIDQAIYDPTLLKSGIKRAYSTGYDFGGPHQGNFCSNGIISPAREVTPKLVEVKKVYQYIKLTDFDSNNKTVKLKNRYAFTNLNGFRLKYTVLEDGISIETGYATTLPSVAPGEDITVNIPFNSSAFKANKEYLINLELTLTENNFWNEWAVAGQSFASEQFGISKASTLQKITASALQGTITVEETGSQLKINGSNFNATFNKTNGKIIALQMDGVSVIYNTKGFEFDNFRYVENDVSIPSVKTSTFENTPLSFSIGEDNKSVTVSTTRKATGECEYQMNYTFYANGAIDIDTRFTPLKANLLRLGLSFMMNKNLSNVNYYARGPMENYVDRKTGSFLGNYSTTIDDMVQDYVRPQTMGNREDLRRVTFTDTQVKGITIETEGKVNFSALRYSDIDLVNSMHFYDLVPSKSVGTTVHLDYMQKGIGNGSCGQNTGTIEKYKITSEAVGYKLRITPASGVTMPDYCTPAGNTKTEAYVNEIKTNGSKNAFNYSTTSGGNLYNHLASKIEALPGAKLNFQIVSNNLGAYTESAQLNDFRQNYAAVFMDKNNDLKFTEDELIKTVGLRGSQKPAGGNMDVLDFSFDINLPEAAENTEYRLRIIFDDATYTGSIVNKACGTIVNGAVYDLDVIIKPTTYCTPGGTFHKDEKAFLSKIETTGAQSDYLYTSDSFPGSVYVRPNQTAVVKPGSTFTLKLTANNAGPRGEVHQDLRYNYATIYSDWDLDGQMTQLAVIGKASAEGLDGKIANYDDVLTINHTIDVPANAGTGKGIIRVIYQNAWQPKSSVSPCMTNIYEGVAYDINVDISDTQNSIFRPNSKKADFRIYPMPAKNQLNIEGELNAISTVNIYDLNGKLLQSTPVAQSANSLTLDISKLNAGFYFIKIDGKKETVFTDKLLKL